MAGRPLAPPDPPAHGSAWTPPSAALALRDGIWRAERNTAVSYPDDANDVCFQVEDYSYWFGHRNNVLRALVRQFEPPGTIYDVGGGNGFVAAGLQQDGHQVVVVEPGPGALNALNRGVTHVVQATLQDACFRDGSIPAIGAFDVIEHIEDDAAFLAEARRLLQPEGRFYCTVPALGALWSQEDVDAGHFRRYTLESLRTVFVSAGFDVEYLSYFFSWLVLPLFLLRGRRTPRGPAAPEKIAANHRLPRPLVPLVGPIHGWELRRVTCRKTVPFGSSLIVVARRQR